MKSHNSNNSTFSFVGDVVGGKVSRKTNPNFGFEYSAPTLTPI